MGRGRRRQRPWGYNGRREQFYRVCDDDEEEEEEETQDEGCAIDVHWPARYGKLFTLLVGSNEEWVRPTCRPDKRPIRAIVLYRRCFCPDCRDGDTRQWYQRIFYDEWHLSWISLGWTTTQAPAFFFGKK